MQGKTANCGGLGDKSYFLRLNVLRNASLSKGMLRTRLIRNIAQQ
jgi:hypothetical protein